MVVIENAFNTTFSFHMRYIYYQILEMNLLYLNYQFQYNYFTLHLKFIIFLPLNIHHHLPFSFSFHPSFLTSPSVSLSTFTSQPVSSLYQYFTFISILYSFLFIKLNMEKSMIQHLGNLTMSEPLSPKSTFTTTLNDGTSYEMKKSRINNLPGHNKSDMSLRLPFVVIFQTIEIERLSLQIESLRVSLKDSQRQAFNCQSYEVQIKELTEECDNYERQKLKEKEEVDILMLKKEKLEEELEKLKKKLMGVDPNMNEKYALKNRECEDLKNENKKLKVILEDLSQTKEKELNDIRATIKMENDSALETCLQDLNAKYGKQQSIFENEIKKLQQLNKEKDGKIEKIIAENSVFQLQNQTLRGIEKQKNQLEDKLLRQVEENVELTKMMRQTKEENEKAKEDINYLVNQINGLEEKINPLELEAAKVPLFVKTIDEMKNRETQMTKKNIKYVEEVQKILPLEENYKRSQEQVKNMESLIWEKDREINEKEKAIERLKLFYEEGKRNEEKIAKLERKINEVQYEKQRISESLQMVGQQLNERELRSRKLESELCRLEEILQEKQRLEEQYKKKLQEMEDIQNQNSKLHDEIQNCEEILEFERQSIKKNLRQISQLNDFIEEKQDYILKLKSHNQKLEEKNQKLALLQEKLDKYKRENAQFSESLKFLQLTVEEKVQDTVNLRYQLKNIESGMKNQKQLQKKLQTSIEKRQNLLLELEQVHKQKQFSEDQVFQIQARLRKVENNLDEAQYEKDELRKKIEKEEREGKMLRNEISQKNKQIEKLREIEEEYYATKKKINEIEKICEQLEAQLRVERENNSNLRYQCDKYTLEIQKIKTSGYITPEFKAKWSQIKAEADSKQNQAKILEEKIKNFQTVIFKLKTKLTEKKQLIMHQNNQWNCLMEDIVSQIQEVKEIGGLKEEILNLMEENLKLEGTVKALNLQAIQTQNRRSSGMSHNTSILSRKTFDSFTPLQNLSYVTKSKLSTKEPLSFRSSQVTSFRN